MEVEKKFEGVFERPFLNKLFVGSNNYRSQNDFTEYPKEILRSPINRYFLIFVSENLMNIEFLKDEVRFLDFPQFIEVTSQSIDEYSPTESNERALFVYPEFKVAIAKLTTRQLSLIAKRENLFTVQPERYIQGVHLSNSRSQVQKPKPSSSDWAIRKLNLDKSKLTGKNVKVAVLDTGFQIDHPDFDNRNVIRKSFIENDIEDDDHGHGMHTTGIAFGHKDVHNGIRYGIAYETEIYSGKILDFTNRGVEKSILDGILWAKGNGCRVILLCVEIPNNGHGYPDDYVMHETITEALQNDGIFIIAAAGNSSQRSLGNIHPLGKPASYQYAISVGAVDEDFEITDFSNQAQAFQTMNYAAPGVDVYSSWSKLGHPNVLRRRESGTSMAAPFVAGILALLIEQNPKAPYYQILGALNRSLISNKEWDSKDYGKGIPSCPI